MITPAHAFFNWAFLRKWLPPWWVVGGSVLPDVPAFLAFFYLIATRGLNQGAKLRRGHPFRLPDGERQPEPPAGLHGGGLPVTRPAPPDRARAARRLLAQALALRRSRRIGSSYRGRPPDPRRGRLRAALPVPRGLEGSGPISYWNPAYGADTFGVIQVVSAALVLSWLVAERLLARRKARPRKGRAGR